MSRFTDARLKSPPSDKFKKYVTLPGLQNELERFYQYILIELSHAVMLVEEGILSIAEGKKILEVLLEIEKIGPEKLPIDPENGSFLFQVESYLFKKIGEEIGGKLHIGRSRNDYGASGGRLYCRDKILEVLDYFIILRETLIEVASRHVQTVMPGYTHIQHAQPLTFAHILIASLYVFERDSQRITGAYERTNLNCLGAVAMSGTSWPINRNRTTELTGCRGLIVNSKDAIGFVNDYTAEILAVLSILLSNLGRMMSDLYIYSTSEFGMIEFADDYCSSSSIMPQKKNPYSVEVCLDQAGMAAGWLASGLGVLRNATTTDGYTLSVVQSVGRQLNLPNVFHTTVSVLDLAAGLLGTMKVNEALMKQRANAFWGTASNLADVIVKETGLSFRMAHKIVGRLVRNAISEGKAPSDITTEMCNAAAKEMLDKKLDLSNELITKALDVEEFLKTRVTIGSPNPKEVRRMLDECSSHIQNGRKYIGQEKDRIKSARSALNSAIDQILNSV